MTIFTIVLIQTAFLFQLSNLWGIPLLPVTLINMALIQTVVVRYLVSRLPWGIKQYQGVEISVVCIVPYYYIAKLYLLVSTYVVCERLSVIQQQVCLVDFLSVTLSLSDLVFCAFTDVAGSLSQSDLVFCAFTDVAGSLSQSDLVFCAFTDVACG